MCGFVYAQNAPVNKQKPSKRTQTSKPTTIKDTTSIVPSDSVLRYEEEVELDPMDTTPLRESRQSIKSKVAYEARDSMPYDAENKVFYLYGKAKIIQDDLTLEAEFIKVDLNTHIVTATGVTDTAGNTKGKPVFKQAGTEYRANVIKYNTQTKKGYLSEFRTKEGEGYIHGQDVGKTEENQFNIHEAKYTTCNLDSPHYHIAASRIKVIPDNKVVTGPANLQIQSIPTPLMLPFGIFSIKRGQSSGVIIPTYGSSRDRGYFLRDGGYYFGLGEHADYRLTGSFYSNKSWALNNGLRYASRYHFAGDLAVSYVRNIFYEEFDPEYRTSKDFLVTWNHRSDPKARPNTRFSSQVYIASVNPNDGRSYMENNSYNPTNIVNNQLNSSISYNRSFKNGRYNFSTNANMSQNTLTRDVILSFPEAVFTVSSFTPFKSKYKSVADKWYENISVGYIANAKNRIITKDSILFSDWSNKNVGRFLDTASSYGMVQTVPIQTSFKVLKYYTLGANVTLNEYWYGKTIRKEVENGVVKSTRVNGFERASTYSPSVTLNTRYYGMKNFSKGKIAAIRHVVAPTIGANYAPDFGDPKYGYYQTYKDAQGRDIRYSIFEGGIAGGPGIGEQGNLSFGLDNNLEMKVRRGKDTAQKEEKIQIFERLAFNGAYNFLADSLKLSTIQILAQTKLFKNITVVGNASLDPYVHKINTVNGYKYVDRMDQFSYGYNSTLGKFTNASLNINGSFNPQTFKKKTSDKKQYENELKYINDAVGEYYDFNIPWTFNVYYTVRYDRYNNLNDSTLRNYSQTLGFNGDFNLTSNWKVAFNSGYDFREKKLNPYSSIDIIRQLHCWEFKFNWIPLGPRQSFLFTINVKSSLLQDLKLTRRRDWFDRKI